MVGDCDKGRNVTWTPKSAAHIVQSVKAEDGLLAAVCLKLTRLNESFTITATRDGKLVGTDRYVLG
jgi:hypothetical protein